MTSDVAEHNEATNERADRDGSEDEEELKEEWAP
jgi:hypothetical protein